MITRSSYPFVLTVGLGLALLPACDVVGPPEEVSDGCTYATFFSDPAWHPGGAFVAAEHADSLDTDGDGRKDAYVWGTYLVSVESGAVRLLAPGGGDPAWSPDGRRLAVAAAGVVYVLDVLDLEGAVAGPPTRVTPGEDAHFPAWSPDGRRLLYRRNEEVPAPPGASTVARIVNRVEVVGLDGSGPDRFPVPDQYALDEVDWSLDGALLVGWGYPPGGDGYDPSTDGPEVLVVDTLGVMRARLSRNRLDDFDPAWSPDGARVAYLSVEGHGRAGVRFASPQGAPLGGLPYDDVRGFDWSPDGRRVVAVRHDGRADRASGQLWLLEADGSGGRPLSDYFPAWGQRLRTCGLG